MKVTEKDVLGKGLLIKQKPKVLNLSIKLLKDRLLSLITNTNTSIRNNVIKFVTPCLYQKSTRTVSEKKNWKTFSFLRESLLVVSRCPISYIDVRTRQRKVHNGKNELSIRTKDILGSVCLGSVDLSGKSSQSGFYTVLLTKPT